MKSLLKRTLRWLHHRRKQVVVSVSVLVVISGALLVLNTSNRPGPASATRQVITYSTDTPDEEKPGKDFVWKGLAGDPKSISLPTIGANGYIQNVGVDQKKAVAVPNNIHMAGWYVDMAKPGDQGLSVIDGHVNGRKNDGIFKNLIKLKKGDVFLVTFGNDTNKSFEVDEVLSLKTEDSASVLFSQKPGILNQLNLITCGGTFDSSKQQYDQRIIVIAKVRL